jgi:hypothetical protein
MKEVTILSICLSLILVSFIEWKDGDLTDCYVVLGQAHFVFAYFYKIKSKKIQTSLVIGYLFLSIFLFGSYVYWNYYDLLFFFTSLYFVVHFVLDIFFFNKIEVTVKTLIRTSLPLFIVFLYLTNVNYIL